MLVQLGILALPLLAIFVIAGTIWAIRSSPEQAKSATEDTQGPTR